ncbi:hypothetical protein SLE2022_391060 [Rubroshorea leprosula]
MAGVGRNVMVNGGRNLPIGIYGRMIPKRGRVKVAILVGIANSVASIFARSSCCSLVLASDNTESFEDFVRAHGRV